MSAPPPSFKLQQFDVVLGDPDAPPSTWEYHRVTALPRDEIMAGDLIAKHKQWPSLADNQVRAGYLKAFYALKRTGLYTESWDQFEADMLDVDLVDEQDVPPTQTATGDGSEQT